MIMIKCLIKTTVFTNIFIIILKKNIYYIENKNLCIYLHINFFFNIYIYWSILLSYPCAKLIKIDR